MDPNGLDYPVWRLDLAPTEEGSMKNTKAREDQAVLIELLMGMTARQRREWAKFSRQVHSAACAELSRAGSPTTDRHRKVPANP